MSYETKTLPSGIVIENRPGSEWIYCWYIKGTYLLHNEGEPAYEYKNGTKHWCSHGMHHRLDGPSIEYKDGIKFYYINNLAYEETDYWNHSDVIAFKYLKEHPELEAFI